MARALLRSLCLLLSAQLCLGLAAHVTFDWPWAARAVAVAYLAACLVAARHLAARVPAVGPRLLAAALTGALWQAPGLAGTLNRWAEVAGWRPYDGLSDLLDFAMQTFHTVLMPLLTLVPGQGEWAGYYRGLVWASPVLGLAWVVAALWRGAGRCTAGTTPAPGSDRPG